MIWSSPAFKGKQSCRKSRSKWFGKKPRKIIRRNSSFCQLADSFTLEMSSSVCQWTSTSPYALHAELKRKKDIVSCAAIGTEVPGYSQEQPEQTLIDCAFDKNAHVFVVPKTGGGGFFAALYSLLVSLFSGPTPPSRTTWRRASSLTPLTTFCPQRSAPWSTWSWTPKTSHSSYAQ